MSPASSSSDSSDDEDERLRLEACQIVVTGVKESLGTENKPHKSSRHHRQINGVNDDELKEDQPDNQVGKKMASLLNRRLDATIDISENTPITTASQENKAGLDSASSVENFRLFQDSERGIVVTCPSISHVLSENNKGKKRKKKKVLSKGGSGALHVSDEDEDEDERLRRCEVVAVDKPLKPLLYQRRRQLPYRHEDEIVKRAKFNDQVKLERPTGTKCPSRAKSKV